MNASIRNLIFFLTVITVLSSCSSSVPESAKYIPANAMFVMGVNTKGLSKKAAWNALLGSDLFERLRKKSQTSRPADAAKQLDKAGIDFLNTSYVYTVPDKRFDNDVHMVLLVPLDDEQKWEAYVKNVFPGVAVVTKNGFKEIIPHDNVVAGWKNKMLVITNIAHKAPVAAEDAANESEQDSELALMNYLHPSMDTVQTFAELETTLDLESKNALVQNERFKTLQAKGHDVSVWVNYEDLMNQAAMKGGNAMALNMMSNLWKNNIMTAGVDFEKGNIITDLNYYPSDSLKKIYKSFLGSKVENEMIDRVPAKNLDLLAAWHLPPDAVKQMLDMTGLTTMASAGLSESGLSLETILSAFTGDMVVALNDFSMKQQTPDELEQEAPREPAINMLYAFKINNKPAFDKIVTFFTTSNLLQPAGNGSYVVGNPTSPTLQIQTNGQYIVASNKKEIANAWITGSTKTEKLNDAAHKAVYGHAMGVYINVKNITDNINIPSGSSKSDSLILQEGKKLIDYISMNTEDFKEDSYKSSFIISFQNKSENSLLQLIDFAMKASETKDAAVAQAQ